MDLKTLYSLKVFEKLGEPLISAVFRSGSDTAAQDAQKLAELLNISVKLANAAAQQFDIKTPEDGDAIRLSLACVMSGFVAENYAGGRAFDDEVLATYTQQLETLMGFVDHFEGAQEAANHRLRLVDGDPLAVTGRVQYDSEQIALKSLQALMPVAKAVSGFSFGKEAGAFANDVSHKLAQKAVQIRGQLYPHLEDISDQSLVELGILRSLCALYSNVHTQKQKELESLDAKQREESMLSPDKLIDDLWRQLDLSAGVLVSLTQGVIGQSQILETAQQASQEAQDQDQEALGVEVKKAESAKPEVQTSSDIQAAQQEPPKAVENPMSFFKKGNAKKVVKGEKEDEGEEEGSGGRASGDGKGFRAQRLKPGMSGGGMR